MEHSSFNKYPHSSNNITCVSCEQEPHQATATCKPKRMIHDLCDHYGGKNGLAMSQHPVARTMRLLWDFHFSSPGSSSIPRVISLWINRLCRHLQRNQTSSDVPSILRWLCVISRLWPLLPPRPQDSANAIGVWSSVKHTDDKKVPFKCRRKSIEISVSLVFHISEEVSSNWIHLRHR